MAHLKAQKQATFIIRGEICRSGKVFRQAAHQNLNPAVAQELTREDEKGDMGAVVYRQAGMVDNVWRAVGKLKGQ
ncbi:uncharacterized protein GLRG_06422 [Colletotrichum graminicola M1.001]|uniref:Uncharacterized protein n=1 Tax=Colletotrichum graminicola (strain M1.001 / M2 / FGSC 10212) TaxID=645133 RepID=E3QK90_COLGM|nr:uncharacterized protein GLRG_06422 [Colletotrichum graminicola M1.001]EFQ31278.1 hypothetical protein GLRG_06422 [Colletotrichum graminicola M1.001]